MSENEGSVRSDITRAHRSCAFEIIVEYRRSSDISRERYGQFPRRIVYSKDRLRDS